MNNFDDDDLKRVIELSKNDYDKSDEDEDLKRVIELSKNNDIELFTEELNKSDEDLKRIVELSLDDEFNKTIELSKNNSIELFTEELQLEAAIKLSLSTKQPVFQRPVGKIYNIDDIFKDTIFNILINRGCLKDLYSFCTTRWNYYDIIRKECNIIYNFNDKFLSLKQTHPSLIKFKINSFENNKYFDLLGKSGHIMCTKQYYIVANSDKCGCMTKNTILYIKIPVSNEDIIIGRDKNPKTFRCNRNYYFHKNIKGKLKPGVNYNEDAIKFLDSRVYDERCDGILESGY
jgi:hypothetical protein